MSGQRKALIVANDEYEQEALRDLLAPAADAEALGRVLGDPQIGEFAVQVVRNEPAHVIQAHIEELFSESQRDDVLLLHFSGHGLKSESGELFFAASNTRPNRLKSTAVSADFVQRCMLGSRSRSIVLLLDCCYGGAFAQGVKVRAAGDIRVLDSFPRETKSGGGRGRAVITASSAMEFAFEGDQLGDDQHRRPSVFTNALVEGLATGDADRDEDGWVSLNELYEYVFDKVREQNPHQTPSRQIELQGELYLARSRRRRIRPAPLPPDLQAALTDQNMYTRLGAVSELQARLVSENLPAAAGAYEALNDLARTDIRSVAGSATTALSQATLRPEETELHFGEHQQGTAPPHRTLRLLGPPIARACVPRASHDWIRVSETAEGFDVSVDTANTGLLRGTLDLKGPTGEAVISIDVELVSSAPQPKRQAEDQVRQHAHEATDSRQVKPLLVPRLELSATMVDFGQLSFHSESPERRIRLGNAGGGSLNARVATQADWIKLRQDGDEVVVSVDTSAAGEHESAVTVDSDGGSAAIRVQARVVVEDAPLEGDAGTPPGIQLAGPAVQGTGTPQEAGGTAIKQPRRISTKAWVFGGVFAGIVVIAVLIAVLASSRTNSSSTGAVNGTPPLFRDDFSSTANGWTVAASHAGMTGKYINGKYQITIAPVKTAYGLAEPASAPSLNPAPQSITIEASASQLSGGSQIYYGITCRSNKFGDYYYEFDVANGGFANIDKLGSSYKNLAQSSSAPVRSNGPNQLRATCANSGGQNAVHLVFWVNGEKIFDVTDRTNPITGGTVGIAVSNIDNTAGAVEFDNFVVRR